MPRCSECKIKFDAIYFNQKTCADSKCVNSFYQKQKQKDLKKRKTKIKAESKTNADHVQDVQKVFNAFIRERDRGKPCICCGKPLTSKFDAGHYFSVGGNPELRFDEDNCHGQRSDCNQHFHGNNVNYSEMLPKRIGEERFMALKEKRGNPKKYTIPELLHLKNLYKEKTKQLKNAKHIQHTKR